MVPLLHGVWAEVKTLVIGEVKSVPGKDGDLVTIDLLFPSSEKRLALVETHRRGIANVKKVAAIMDGAEWLQFTDYHCPQATRIDFAVGAIGEALHGEHTAESRSWKETRLHQLKHDGPDSLLDELAQVQKDHPADFKQPGLSPFNIHIFWHKAGQSAAELSKAATNWSSKRA
jgi:hypothetical protein